MAIPVPHCCTARNRRSGASSLRSSRRPGQWRAECDVLSRSAGIRRTCRSDATGDFQACVAYAATRPRYSQGIAGQPPAVSQHLRILKEAGLVTYRQDGLMRLYTVNPEAIGRLVSILEEMWREAVAARKVDPERSPWPLLGLHGSPRPQPRTLALAPVHRSCVLRYVVSGARPTALRRDLCRHQALRAAAFGDHH